MQSQNNIPASQYVFIDESGVNTNMSRRYARSLQGSRAHDAIPLNRGKTTTIVSSVRLDGTTVSMLIDGAMNGEKFKDYVQNHLAPQLHKDDVVVMDNLACHKVAGIRETIEGVGAHVAYLPPYSPDLNPIEEMWSKFKAYLRKVKARSHNSLLPAISAAFQLVCTDDISGWFRHSGYIGLCNS
jgi:transposase